MSLSQTKTASVAVSRGDVLPVVIGSTPVNWNNPSNVLVSNNLYAVANFSDGTGSTATSNYLYTSGFDFTLPENAVIEGIIAQVEKYQVGADVTDYYVGLIYPDAPLSITSPGKQFATVWPTTDTASNYGNATDPWNRVWTYDEINSSDFGLAIAAYGDVASLEAAAIDFVQLTLYYHSIYSEDGTGGGINNGAVVDNAIFTHSFDDPFGESSGNVLAGGHAGIIYPNIAATGGAFAGGASLHDHSIFGSGSGLAGGSADVSLIQSEEATNGVSVSGEATFLKVFSWSPHLMGAKVLNNSIASHFYEPLGGALLNGGHDITLNYDSVLSGGILAAPVSFINPVIGHGVANISGTADIDVIYVSDASGSILASGTSTIIITPAIGGSTLIGGAATELTLHLPSISGGLFVYSEEEHAKITPYWDTADGGILALPISFADPYQPFGGSNVGGTADYQEVFDPRLQEYQWTNYLSGEEVVPPDINDEWGWAFCWLNPDTNEFGWDLRFSFTGNARLLTIRGPAEVGETGDVILRIGNLSGGDFTSPVQGSTTITEDQRADLLAGLWYWRIQDWNFNNLRSQIVDRDGVSVGGEKLMTYDSTMEGGIQLSQPQDIEYTRFNPSASGVSLLGGSAKMSINVAVDGGSTCGGSATVEATYVVSPDSGTLVGGDVQELLTYGPTTDGVILAGGTSIIAIAPAISGGAMLVGTYTYSLIISPPVLGGAIVSPGHRQTFFDYYITEGGVLVGGRTIGEKIRTYTKIHLNYGYCMASENILTEVTYEHELLSPTDDVTPDVPTGGFQMQHQAAWCDVEEKCIEGVLPKITQRRQGEDNLPPKVAHVTYRDRGIAKAAL